MTETTDTPEAMAARVRAYLGKLDEMDAADREAVKSAYARIASRKAERAAWGRMLPRSPRAKKTTD